MRNVIKIQFDSKELWPLQGFWVCVHCDLDLGNNTFGQGLEIDIGLWTTIIQIQQGSEELWTEQGCKHCDLELGDMTLGRSWHTLV